MDTIVAYEGGRFHTGAIILFVLGVILFILAFALIDHYEWSWIFIIFAVIAFIGGACVGKIDQKEYTKYEVYISDPTYSAQELVENYKILNQDGLVLTIRENNN